MPGTRALLRPALTFVIDTTNPTATVAITDANLNDGDNSSVVTITFSEAVTGFNASDLTVTNGSIELVSSTDGGLTWTGTFVASDDFYGTGSVTVGGAYADLVGNVGATGATDSVVIDTTNPTATVVITDANLYDGDDSSVVTITFSEAVAGFSASDLAVTNGSIASSVFHR